jgi:hypothetical protein
MGNRRIAATPVKSCSCLPDWCRVENTSTCPPAACTDSTKDTHLLLCLTSCTLHATFKYYRSTILQCQSGVLTMRGFIKVKQCSTNHLTNSSDHCVCVPLHLTVLTTRRRKRRRTEAVTQSHIDLHMHLEIVQMLQQALRMEGLPN